MSRLSPSDYVAAAAPVLGSLSLAEINTCAQIFGALLGAAYLVWKWRREARTPPPPPGPSA
jgi:hypothetical protein